MKGLANDVKDTLYRLKSWLWSHKWKFVGVVGGGIILCPVLGGIVGAVIGGVVGGAAGTIIPKLFKYLRIRKQIYQARLRE